MLQFWPPWTHVEVRSLFEFKKQLARFLQEEFAMLPLALYNNLRCYILP